jgi:hypothetical protein
MWVCGVNESFAAGMNRRVLRAICRATGLDEGEEL